MITIENLVDVYQSENSVFLATDKKDANKYAQSNDLSEAYKIYNGNRIIFSESSAELLLDDLTEKNFNHNLYRITCIARDEPFVDHLVFARRESEAVGLVEADNTENNRKYVDMGLEKSTTIKRVSTDPKFTPNALQRLSEYVSKKKFEKKEENIIYAPS